MLEIASLAWELQKVLPREWTSLKNIGFQLPRLWDPGIKIFHWDEDDEHR